MSFLTIEPDSIPTADFHQYLLGAVAPRPICFASTVNEEGQHNLAPYSFFNVFSSKPPIGVFSSNRRVRGNTTKDTLANVHVTKEVVINVVSHSIVRQMAVASVEYESGISEFETSGLTPIASELVQPPRVQESPVQMECKVQKIIPLGDEGGAGNLIICEIVLMHINENVLDESGRIDPQKIDLMGRMGGAYYVRASGEAVSKIIQPVREIPIGVNVLPQAIRNSSVLSGNDLGLLGGAKEIPSTAAINKAKQELESCSTNTHLLIKQRISEGKIDEALALCFAVV